MRDAPRLLFAKQARRQNVTLTDERSNDRSFCCDAANFAFDKKARLPGMQRKVEHSPANSGQPASIIYRLESSQQRFGSAKCGLRWMLVPFEAPWIRNSCAMQFQYGLCEILTHYFRRIELQPRLEITLRIEAQTLARLSASGAAGSLDSRGAADARGA
jgi:hypothetical protein